MFILTDIEDTTTDIAFVHNILFPYSRERIAPYILLNEDDPTVQACINQVKNILTNGKRIEDCIDYLTYCIDADVKLPALKTLQGLIWREGYEDNTLKGHLYDDVVPVLQSWKAAGIGLGVYSSGSVAAQKLLFGHSIFGDITPLFSHYFDTAVGHKRKEQSYKNIATTLNIPPNEIVFLSDIEAELDAAKSAKMQTIQLVRTGTLASTRHKTVSNFKEIVLST